MITFAMFFKSNIDGSLNRQNKGLFYSITGYSWIIVLILALNRSMKLMRGKYFLRKRYNIASIDLSMKQKSRLRAILHQFFSLVITREHLTSKNFYLHQDRRERRGTKYEAIEPLNHNKCNKYRGDWVYPHSGVSPPLFSSSSCPTPKNLSSI